MMLQNIQHCRDFEGYGEEGRIAVLGRLIVATEVLMAQWYGNPLEVGHS